MAQMGHTDEPKMDDLKRLLRRHDGLDGSKSLAKAQEAEEEHRGYVGALRGAPVIGGEEPPPSIVPPPPKTTSNSGVYIAAATAALISTVTVYLMMSWQQPAADRGAGPGSSQPVVPSKLDFKSPGTGAGQRQSTDADGLVRRAEQLLQGGDIDTARVLLKQAAELGSGYAALKLGRSYDPAHAGRQGGTLRYADSQTNPALAKAWYERALALGTQEAASYISDPGGR
jgi:TPR repeat protein